MAKWIPDAALLGLLCLMIIPAPGIWGVLIGGACVLAIAVSLFMLFIDWMATRILAWRKHARRSRAVDTHSGMTRKA